MANQIPFSPAFFWMESQMPYVLFWLMAFLFVILAKIAVVRAKGIRKNRDSMFFTEAIGLPLTFLQPVVFAKAVGIGDWFGALLTLWWGPGFVFVVVLVLASKASGRKISWVGTELAISWLCKSHYLIYLGLALAWRMPMLIFALSSWIASDQIEKTFASLDADRARRTFHDAWIIRLLYPAFLFAPFFFDLAWYFKLHGAALFALWAGGLFHVWREREFMNLPEDPSLLRNMTYFRSTNESD